MTFEKAKALEILELLKTKLQIPEHIVELTITLKVDENPTIDCKYYPVKMVSNGE